MASEQVDADLPKALVKRIVKAKLAAVDAAAGGDGTRDFQVNKDALLAFCEAGKVFIHYLTATANDVCKEARRQTISADDVATALEGLHVGKLVPALREALEAYKEEAREKSRRKADATKKRKLEKDGEGAGAPAGDAEVGAPDAAAAAAPQELAAEGEEGQAPPPPQQQQQEQQQEGETQQQLQQEQQWEQQQGGAEPPAGDASAPGAQPMLVEMEGA